MSVIKIKLCVVYLSILYVSVIRICIKCYYNVNHVQSHLIKILSTQLLTTIMKIYLSMICNLSQNKILLLLYLSSTQYFRIQYFSNTVPVLYWDPVLF